MPLTSLSLIFSVCVYLQEREKERDGGFKNVIFHIMVTIFTLLYIQLVCIIINFKVLYLKWMYSVC